MTVPNAVIFLRLDQLNLEYNQGDLQPTLTIEASTAGIPPGAWPRDINVTGLDGPFEFVRIMAADTRVYRQPGAGGLTMLVWND